MTRVIDPEGAHLAALRRLGDFGGQRVLELGCGDGRLTVPVAREATMSVRTFTRRFREETGLSPAQWLTRQRVEHARSLLESTDLPVDEIARQAGFGTAVSLRQHLHAAVGVAPLAYRRTFRVPRTTVSES